jgi:hypothetical protein
MWDVLMGYAFADVRLTVLQQVLAAGNVGVWNIGECASYKFAPASAGAAG